MPNLKIEAGKVYYLTIGDYGNGLCEVVATGKKMMTFQWISFTPCYDCQVYDELLYLGPSSVSYDEIYEIKEGPFMTSEEIWEKRREAMKYDKPIFTRFRAAKKEESECQI